MADDIAIRVENLSKRYRIGAKEKVHDTFAGMLSDWMKRPGHNLRGLRSLTRFDENEQEPEDIIWALKDVSFEVERGEVVGIIGRNGAGKSTLLKILSRITHPTTGRVELNGRVSSLLEVGTGFHPELTGRENIYLNGTILGMRKVEIDRKFDEIVDFSGVEKFIDTPVKRYSSGMRVRLAFSVAANLEPEVLLIDEVLAVGDIEFQRKCLGKMNAVAREGRTVLFVSHNMGAVSNLCDFCMLLQDGGVIYRGITPEAIRIYNLTTIESSNDRKATHVIYEARDAVPHGFSITRVELLNETGAPLTVVATWENVTFRISFVADKEVERGSVALQIKTIEGNVILLLSTQPDSTVPLRIRKGEQSVDCNITRLPLAAGEYLVGVGVAVPNMEWLVWEQEIGRMMVAENDIYGSGRSPTYPRTLIAVQHRWSLVDST